MHKINSLVDKQYDISSGIVLKQPTGQTENFGLNACLLSKAVLLIAVCSCAEPRLDTMYSGTPLSQNHLGLEIMSLLEKCPDFRSCAKRLP